MKILGQFLGCIIKWRNKGQLEEERAEFESRQMSGDPSVMCFLFMNCPASTAWRWVRLCLTAVLGFSQWPPESESL